MKAFIWELIFLERKKNYLATVLFYLVFCAIIFDLILTILSPWWLKVAYEKGYAEIFPMYDIRLWNTLPSGDYMYMLIFVIFCGIAISIALFQGAKLLLNVKKGEPFKKENAESLQTAAICAFALSIIFALKMFYTASMLTIISIILFGGGGLLLMVFSELFREAAVIKEENDLTI